MSNLSAPLPVMAGEDMPAGPTDPIFNRLLKDRIIWMGEEVKDEMANRICAQMLMLAAEDPKKDIWLYINSNPQTWQTDCLNPNRNNPQQSDTRKDVTL